MAYGGFSVGIAYELTTIPNQAIGSILPYVEGAGWTILVGSYNSKSGY